MGKDRHGMSLRIQMLHRFDGFVSRPFHQGSTARTPSSTARGKEDASVTRPTPNMVTTPRRAPARLDDIPSAPRVERCLLDERAWVLENGY